MALERKTTEVARTAPPYVDRGKMLLVDDIIELLKELSNGRLVRSRQWVMKFFAPEYKRRFGRDPYWREKEARAWLAEYGDRER